MPARFGAGEFYGALERRQTGGSFDMRALAASGREEDVEPHSHDTAHFILVLAGTYISSACGAPAYARPPFLVFDPPGTWHRDRFREGKGAFLAVGLTESAFAGLDGVMRPSEAATMLDHPRALAAAFSVARGLADPILAESAGWELVAALDRPAEASRGRPRWLGRAYETIMDAPDQSVAAIAAALGIHPVHLARRFRQEWGCSPGELLRWRRADQAASLLRRTALPLAEVAAATGFADQSHLTKIFRARFGTTPSLWRRDVAPIQDGRPTPR